MAKSQSKRSIITSYDKLSEEAKTLLLEKYPEGYRNYISKYPKPDGSFFYAVTLDTEDTNYLVKVDVKIDSVFNDSEFDMDIVGTASDKDIEIVSKNTEEIDDVEDDNYDDDVEDDDEE